MHCVYIHIYLSYTYTYIRKQKEKIHITSQLTNKINALYLVSISTQSMLAGLINRIRKFILWQGLCWVLMTISHLIFTSSSERRIPPTFMVTILVSTRQVSKFVLAHLSDSINTPKTDTRFVSELKSLTLVFHSNNL